MERKNEARKKAKQWNSWLKNFLSLLFIFSSSFVSVQALNDCPFGEKHDSCKYPGKCGGYADTDKNDTCDHSQSVFEINHDQEIKEEKYRLKPIQR